MDQDIYLVDFVWRGRLLSCRIEAEDWAEAEDRLDALVETGRIAGRLLMEGETDGPMTGSIGLC